MPCFPQAFALCSLLSKLTLLQFCGSPAKIVLSNSQDQVQGVRRTGASVSSFSQTLALRCRRPQTFWQRRFKKSALLLSSLFAGEPFYQVRDNHESRMSLKELCLSS